MVMWRRGRLIGPPHQYSFSFLHWQNAIIHKNIGRLTAAACFVAVYLSYILCFLVYFSVYLSYIPIIGWIFKYKCRKCLSINDSTLWIAVNGFWKMDCGVNLVDSAIWIVHSVIWTMHSCAMGWFRKMLCFRLV